MKTCASLSLEATLISLCGENRKHKYATSCFLGCRNFIEKLSDVDVVFSLWLCSAALINLCDLSQVPRVIVKALFYFLINPLVLTETIIMKH